MPAIARTTNDSHRHYELLTGRCNTLLSILGGTTTHVILTSTIFTR